MVYEFDTLVPTDGVVDFRLRRRSGEFDFKGAELNAVANPIPSTVLLFGVGLIGLVGLRKSFRK